MGRTVSKGLAHHRLRTSIRGYLEIKVVNISLRCRTKLTKDTHLWSLVLSSHNRCQFHQRSTSSFYPRRSQKRKKDSQVKQLLCAFGISARVKSERKMLAKLTTVRMHYSRNPSLSNGIRNWTPIKNSPTNFWSHFKRWCYWKSRPTRVEIN